MRPWRDWLDRAVPWLRLYAGRAELDLAAGRLTLAREARRSPPTFREYGASLTFVRAPLHLGLAVELGTIGEALHVDFCATPPEPPDTAPDGGPWNTVETLDRIEAWHAAEVAREQPFQDVAALHAAALRAGLGRPTLPTDDEGDVHDAMGGRWLVQAHSGPLGVFGLNIAWVDPAVVAHVWALDRDGRPCVWPTVSLPSAWRWPPLRRRE